MAITVGNATPRTISGINVANPAGISGVGNANPVSGVPSVVNNYGFQTSPYYGAPQTIRVGGGTGTLSSDPNAFSGAVNSAFGSTAPAPVYAPRLDIAGINAQARTAAENAVNPFYTKTLSDFLSQQAAQKQQQEEQTATNIQNIKDTLKNTQEANTLTGERTAEDVATKTGQIDTAQNQNQIDTGNQFETDRLLAAKGQAANGILGTGAGNRQTGVAIIKRNTTEGTQNDQFQAEKDTQALFKARTFEDLAKSTELATTTEAKGEKQANFDLNSYIKNAGFAETSKRNELNQARLNEINTNSAQQAKILFANYLAGISNPAQYEAAVRTYGGSF